MISAGLVWGDRCYYGRLWYDNDIMGAAVDRRKLAEAGGSGRDGSDPPLAKKKSGGERVCS